MTISKTNVIDRDWWLWVASEATKDADFAKFSRHLSSIVVRFEIDSSGFGFLFHRGALQLVDAEEPSLTVSGPQEAWSELVSGETVWAQAVNPHLGRLKVQGDPLIGVWLTRPLWQLWRITSDRRI